MRQRAMSRMGLQFLGELEGGFHLEAYDDGAGYLTIGLGHLIMDHEREELLAPGGISMDRAIELAEDDTREAVEAVVRALDSREDVIDVQHRLDALACFAFNIGAGAFRRSTLVRRLVAGEHADTVVREELPRWNKAGGRVMQGLVKRRRETVELFVDGDYIRHWHELHELRRDEDVVRQHAREEQS